MVAIFSLKALKYLNKKAIATESLKKKEKKTEYRPLLGGVTLANIVYELLVLGSCLLLFFYSSSFFFLIAFILFSQRFSSFFFFCLYLRLNFVFFVRFLFLFFVSFCLYCISFSHKIHYKFFTQPS